MAIPLQLLAESHALVPLFVAALFGALIGIERSIAGKQAGMRTYALVSLGSCLFIVISQLVASAYAGSLGLDPLRVAAAIVMGIGFIGTGLVVMREDRPVGITTAAGIWVAAAVGVAAGYQLYLLALAVTVLTLAILLLFIPIERAIDARFGSPPRLVVEREENEMR